MKRLAIIAPLVLAGCQLTAFPVKLPSPAELCALSPATLARLAQAMNTDAAALTAACEIVN